MNRLTTERRAQIVRALVEGNSIRATCRMTGAAKNTVSKLLLDLGEACTTYQAEVMWELPCERIQIDEIWSFVGAKARNVPEERKDEFGYGDVWTFTALCADTKLVPVWMLGERTVMDAIVFLSDVRDRLSRRERIQVTTDGHGIYRHTVPDVFGKRLDFAQLIKIYGTDSPHGETRYSPAICRGTDVVVRAGNPDPDHISTSYVERQNLTMRMNMRRFTRLTNAFSKKVENLNAAVALHFMHYNFVRVHQTLKTTPAVAAEVTNKVWTIEDVVGLLDAVEKPKPN